MNQEGILCDLHDYVEVACMYHYQLKLILKDNQIIEGKAIDIITSTEKQEYLIISNGQEQYHIELTQLAKMQATTPNARFSEILF
ncbi:transcriptional antiterminator, Rof [Nitrosomonas cryotolerans]|uniref:Transcriptional antiterminator, Rof n=1 Tax=Nitrosomonas cryotolerans ATCC 49181 TaxID=1131553 RepID=A0A1N6IHZ0_9PROT|nr:Rho-binding antiterminator [Nitrosomonas cryotolerans]SFP90093.1 transcriptional antiterminator, Rof [Nitrosomonas cryotolerans]SIO31628.1 transcriptional antiterminator, Rof [Nitrosomonas cryotolerans ATCC 49181]